MTRTSQVRPPLRLVAAGVIAAALLPLSGCLYAQIPANIPDGTGPDPEPTTESTDGPVDEPAGGPPATMSFADGTDLAPTVYTQWGDGFFADAGWKVVKPDDGNGGWTYGTVDDTCTAQFWQGLISDVPVVEGDDSATSDAMLAVILGDATAAEVTPPGDHGRLRVSGRRKHRCRESAGLRRGGRSELDHRRARVRRDRHRLLRDRGLRGRRHRHRDGRGRRQERHHHHGVSGVASLRAAVTSLRAARSAAG